MLRLKVLSIVLMLVLALEVLAGCSSGSSGKLTDGNYKVEFDSYDSHGYKPQLEITVSGGKITDAKFDEVTEDGQLKSKDEKYKKNMEEASGTYPEKAYAELIQQLLTKQSADVDTISGATSSSKDFKALAKYAINNMAKKGKTDPAKISAPK